MRIIHKINSCVRKLFSNQRHHIYWKRNWLQGLAAEIYGKYFQSKIFIFHCRRIYVWFFCIWPKLDYLWFRINFTLPSLQGIDSIPQHYVLQTEKHSHPNHSVTSPEFFWADRYTYQTHEGVTMVGVKWRNFKNLCLQIL